MNLAEVEKVLREAMDAQRARGVRIVRDAFGVYDSFGDWRSDGSCCALGALALHKQPEPRIADVFMEICRMSRNTFGWFPDETEAFLDGFDGSFDFEATEHAEIADLGRRLSIEYVGPFEEEASL